MSVCSLEAWVLNHISEESGLEEPSIKFCWFTHLPTELQRLIWIEYVRLQPPRLIKMRMKALDSKQFRQHHPEKSTIAPGVPAILQFNQVAREVGLEFYKRIMEDNTLCKQAVYFNFEKDTLICDTFTIENMVRITKSNAFPKRGTLEKCLQRLIVADEPKFSLTTSGLTRFSNLKSIFIKLPPSIRQQSTFETTTSYVPRTPHEMATCYHSALLKGREYPPGAPPLIFEFWRLVANKWCFDFKEPDIEIFFDAGSGYIPLLDDKKRLPTC